MPQYVLADRPFILSKHKRNCIHGRPISPISSLRSVRSYLPTQTIRGPSTEDKRGDALHLKSHVSMPSTSWAEYHKTAQENLITINNNLSNMLQETFSGIDNICKKVRLCLLEANNISPSEHTQKFALTKNLTRETIPQPSICEKVEQNNTNDDIANIEHESLEILEEDNIDEEEEKETEKKENEKKESEAHTVKPKRIPSITPFFTILNPKTYSAESVGVAIIKSVTSKIGLSRKCTAERFQETMKEVEKLKNYESVLSCMVEDINREIDSCYSKHTDEATNSTKKNKKNTRINKEKRAKCSPLERQTKSSTHRFGSTQRINEIKQCQNDFTEKNMSENDLANCKTELVSRSSAISEESNFSCVDVYRKRAITDIHKKMVAQLEANDSLLFFQKLMAKNRKYLKKNKINTSGDVVIDKKSSERRTTPRTPTQITTTRKRQSEKRSFSDLVKKYRDSLWFKQKTAETKRMKRDKELKKSDKSSRTSMQKCLPQSYSVQSSQELHGNQYHKKPSKKASTETCRSSHSKMSHRALNMSSLSLLEKQHQKVAMNTVSASQVPTSCYLSVTNNQPLSEPMKCKLHWMRAKYSQLSHKKLKYLDILDDITKNDLIPLRAEYPRRDEIVKTNSVKDTYLYKLLYGKGTDIKKAWSELLEPSTMCSDEKCKRCNDLKVLKEEDYKETEHITKKKSTLQANLKSERTQAFNMLSKYIFPESPDVLIKKTVYTVMPVHVYYDTPRIGTSNRRPDPMPSKLPLLPMKESKEPTKKAEWTTESVKKPKPMRVVYDPVLRKIEKEIQLVSARHDGRCENQALVATNSWSPKNFNQYCSSRRATPGTRTVKFDAMDRVLQKPQQKPPVKGTRTTPVAELFKRSSKSTPEQPRRPVTPLWSNSSHQNTYHKDDIRVQKKIQKEVEMQASRLSNDQERKIWENKYGKTVGQKLLNFIEKQPAEYQIPIPKYALPHHVKETVKKTVKETVKETVRETMKESTRQQQMLAQLRTLKKKNDNIQNNIQKAIEVIENKMVDLLTNPGTTQSIDAFDEMEKEISNVLSMMKAPQAHESTQKKETSRKVDDYSKDMNKISEELFRKLNKILESPAMTTSCSEKSSKNSLIHGNKFKHKDKSSPTSINHSINNSDMNQVCFSSTSATGEEKFTITGISPKRPNKSSMAPPFMRTPITDGIIEPEEFAKISSELRKLRNELKYHKSSEELKRPDMIKMLEAIDESEIPKDESFGNSEPALKENVVFNKSKFSPLQEQVINIALIDTAKKHSSSDVFMEVLPENSEEQTAAEINLDDDPSRSMGDGYYLGQSDDHSNKTKDTTDKNNEKLQEKVEEIKIDQDNAIKKSLATEENERLETSKQSEVKQQETIVAKEQRLDYSESSGPYFTPKNSPLSASREVEIKRKCHTIEEKGESTYEQTNLSLDGRVKSTNTNKESVEELSSLETEKLQTIKEIVKEDDEYFNDKQLAAEQSEGTDREHFYQNVSKIISRVESVYNQLEEFEEELRTEEIRDPPSPKIAVFQESTNTEEVHSDIFLTPFMHAVKDLRKTASEGPSSLNTSPRLNKSPSYFNVLNFLDSLADLKEERPTEVHISREVHFAYTFHIPVVYHQTAIENQSSLSVIETSDLRKRSGCLKKPSSHLNMNSGISKSKQRVSFLLRKEEKGTQVTACPLHAVKKIHSTYSISSENATSSTKKDEQVSAYLDAVEDKSTDKMSLLDDDSSNQNTLGFSEEMSLEKVKMPEQVVQNIQETIKKEENTNENGKNVVEIFRNNSPEDKGTEVKVFYDNYQKTHNLDSKIISGFYNEESILQVKESLHKNSIIKKRDSLEKLTRNINPEKLITQLLKETSLFKPLKNLNSFIDSELLKDAIEQRRRVRMMRRKSASSLISNKKRPTEADDKGGKCETGENENLLKGIYVFVYLLMFTALNLEYKCIQ